MSIKFVYKLCFVDNFFFVCNVGNLGFLCSVILDFLVVKTFFRTRSCNQEKLFKFLTDLGIKYLGANVTLLIDLGIMVG